MKLQAMIVLAALCWMSVLGGCGREEPLGPPAIRMGRDECVKCGMSIVEDRYSCGLLVLEQGHLETLLFDDIGDMLDHERAIPALVVKRRYVHDANTRAWHEAERCTFIYAESVHTPMASGLAAFGDEASAKAHAERESGRMFTFEQVGAFRVQWRKDRHGR